MVRVYVKVQCVGFVLRLDEEGRKKESVIVISGFKAGTRDIRPIGDGNFFDVAASCRSSLLPNHHPLALLPSSSFIHINDKRHHDVDEDCDRVTRHPVEEDLAGRSPISFHKGRSHPCFAEQLFALSDIYQLLFIFVSSTLISLYTPQGVYILKVSWKYS